MLRPHEGLDAHIVLTGILTADNVQRKIEVCLRRMFPDAQTRVQNYLIVLRAVF